MSNSGIKERLLVRTCCFTKRKYFVLEEYRFVISKSGIQK